MKTAKDLLFIGAVGLVVGCDPKVADEPDAPRARRDAMVTFDTNTDAFTSDAGLIPCADNDACDDGVDCNGIETCVDGACRLGTAPSCADDVDCTIDTCDLVVGDCVHRAPDGDGDGAFDANCLDTRGLPLGTDCDDANARRAPGNLEVCDIEGVDEDCDLDTRGGLDADHDGFEDARCCNPMRATDTRPNCGPDCLDAARSVSPMGTETCNGIDDNCSGVIDEVCTCSPGVTRPCTLQGVCSAGVETCTNGLVWSACSIAPELVDVCNGRDEDCDGTIDEGTAVLCFRDSDNDGFAEAGRPSERRCPDEDRARVGRCPVDYTNRAPTGMTTVDCCDRDRRVHPDLPPDPMHPRVPVFHTIRSYCADPDSDLDLEFDFNCDGVEQQANTVVADENRCTATTESSCNSSLDAPGWLAAVPNCGVGGTLLTGCFWFNLSFGDNCTFTPAGEIQGCR